MTTTHKIFLAVAILAVAMIFPLTAKFNPAPQTVGDAFDASKVYQFGGKGFFHSEAKLSRISDQQINLAGRTTQLPEATVDAWIDEPGTETITPAHAHSQAKRISETLNIPIRKVNRLIDEHTNSNFIGGDSVSIQDLNTALVDRQEKNL